jgi:hypothetical protein
LKGEPKPISEAERRKRLERIAEISSELGFVGSVTYVHAYSQSGGAQYCIGPSASDDIMVLYAEAFERDADPEDFPLDAMIAHECGHQHLLRRPKLHQVLAQYPGADFEEILASVVGSLLLGDTESAKILRWKAEAELTDMGLSVEYSKRYVENLQTLLRQLI